MGEASRIQQRGGTKYHGQRKEQVRSLYSHQSIQSQRKPECDGPFVRSHWINPDEYHPPIVYHNVEA